MTTTTTKFQITLHTNSDIEPAEKFASVLHIESDCGCDFYENGDELEWQDGNGMLSNCDGEIVDEARNESKKLFA